MRHLIKLTAVAFIASAAAVSAATYQIDGLLSNYGASLIHSQDYNGDMSGYTVARFDEAVASGGTWAENGDIAFSGTLRNGGLNYSAKGNIDTNGGGYLSFLFSNAYDAVSYVFNFDGDLSMGVYNGFADGVISLWGDTGTCSRSYSYYSQSHCYGMDLRIAVSEVPSQVPLPASALLLLGGVGAFAGMRRKKS